MENQSVNNTPIVPNINSKIEEITVTFKNLFEISKKNLAISVPRVSEEHKIQCQSCWNQ